MDKDDLEEIIEHFTHPHPLKLIQLVYDSSRYNNYRCYCCGRIYRFDGDGGDGGEIVMYACIKRECLDEHCKIHDKTVEQVYMCVLCARLGESIERHAFHPRHPQLNLLVSSSGYRCGACREYIENKVYSYHCDEEKCYFEMHVRCAHSLKPSVALPNDGDRGRSHSHLLALFVRREGEDNNCESCQSSIPWLTTFARCVPCNLDYHIYCDRDYYIIPGLIMYLPGHPQHPLSVRRRLSYWSCDVCCKIRDWPGDYMLTCLECNNFNAHISCVFQFFPCPFPRSTTNVVDMRLEGGPVHEAAQCQGCRNRFHNNEVSIYGCQYCNFYLHESCIGRWLQISMVEDKEHKTIISYLPYDLEHKNPLVLVCAHGEYFCCACCSEQCYGFKFQDQNDDRFAVSLECMLLMPSVFFNLVEHDHPVVLLQKRDATKKSYLRCLSCFSDFSINYMSCRFPHTLLHECHSHPLTLVSSLVGNGDADQCYCDVCEDKRDPAECIYYCVECKFEAHIACVKTKVLYLCGNKPKDVKFVTIEEIKQNERAQETESRIRYVYSLKKKLQHSHTQVHKELDGIFRIAPKITWENTVCESPSYKEEFLSIILYSDGPFKKFVQDLNSTFLSKRTYSALESLRNEEVVCVGEYMVPLNFDDVLETLFDKYGDFRAECTCSPEAKHYLFVGLCKALQSMCNTKVARVTENLLAEWWTWLAMGKAAGFKVQFALEILGRVVYAHFGLEADKYADNELTNCRKKIRELPEKMEKLAREFDETRRELEGAIEKENELRDAAFRVKKSALMRKCLTEAEDLVCYSVGEMLLPPSE